MRLRREGMEERSREREDSLREHKELKKRRIVRPRAEIEGER